MNPNTFKNSVPYFAVPMKFTEESPKGKTSFLVDDIVNARDQNASANSPYSDRRLVDSNHRNRAQQTSEGLPLSKPGIDHLNFPISQFIN